MNVSRRNTTQHLSSDIFDDIKSSESPIDSDTSVKGNNFNQNYSNQQRTGGDNESIDSVSSTTTSNISDIEQNQNYSEFPIVNPFNIYPKYNYCPPGYLQPSISSDTRSRREDSRPSSRNSYTSGALTSATTDIFAAAAAAAAAASTSSLSTISSTASASSSSTGSARSGSANQLTTALSNDSNAIVGGNINNNQTADDHLQRLAQMTHGVGILKTESGKI